MAVMLPPNFTIRTNGCVEIRSESQLVSYLASSLFGLQLPVKFKLKPTGGHGFPPAMCASLCRHVLHKDILWLTFVADMFQQDVGTNFNYISANKIFLSEMMKCRFLQKICIYHVNFLPRKYLKGLVMADGFDNLMHLILTKPSLRHQRMAQFFSWLQMKNSRPLDSLTIHQKKFGKSYSPSERRPAMEEEIRKIDQFVYLLWRVPDGCCRVFIYHQDCLRTAMNMRQCVLVVRMMQHRLKQNFQLTAKFQNSLFEFSYLPLLNYYYRAGMKDEVISLLGHNVAGNNLQRDAVLWLKNIFSIS